MGLLNIPLLIIPFTLYNLFALIMGYDAATFATAVYQVQMLSGATWTITLSDVMIAVGLFFLFLEILKATRPAKRSIVDHMLSTVLFIAALVEFLLVHQVGTSTFALLILMMLVDVVAGYSVSIRSAGRDVSLDN